MSRPPPRGRTPSRLRSGGGEGSSGSDPSSSTRSRSCVLANVRAVIFDVDGTLADSGRLGFDATLTVLERHGAPPVSYEEYCRCTRYTTPDRLARHAGFEPGMAGYEATGAALGREFDDLYIDRVSMATAPFYDGMVDLVLNLPDDVHCGALTNAANRYAHAVLRVNSDDECAAAGAGASKGDRRRLYERFGSVLGADTVPKPKPHPDGLLLVCSQLDPTGTTATNRLTPNECVYVGDSPSDGMAARAANMASIAVTWGAHTRAALEASDAFDYVCDTVEELAALLPQKVPAQAQK
jgi:phosphoglycolate phosphatase-like HAD superfamily hydrolase